MGSPVDLPNIRIITVSGRIGAGSTSLAKHLAQILGWKHLEGGEIFWEAVRKKLNLAPKDTDLRPDEEDVLFEERQKEILQHEKHIVLESKLAGFCAKDMPDVFRVAVVCEDAAGQDQPEIRIDRLVNREHISTEDAKAEVLEREINDLSKWRRLYADNDSDWTYWDKKYYNLVVNTFSHNQEESLSLVVDAIGYKKESL
jgi:cytidylate kinase